MGRDWARRLYREFSKPYMKRLSSFITQRRKQTIVRPDGEDVYKALKLTEWKDVNVVILGQDPYPSAYADGLAFSSGIGWECPKSLEYIWQEVEKQCYDGLNVHLRTRNDLDHVAAQGVLLLNSRLTVDDKNAGSHADKGWEIFIRRIIEELNKRNEPILWCLWGGPAKRFLRYIDKTHEVVMADHPIAAAYRGKDFEWNSNNSFSKINKFLTKHGKHEIEWCASNYYS
jgi:uracil-DNA glycosylase